MDCLWEKIGVLYGVKYAHDNERLLQAAADPEIMGRLRESGMALLGAVSNCNLKLEHISNEPQKNTEEMMKLTEYCEEKGRKEGMKEGMKIGVIDGAISAFFEMGFAYPVIRQKIVDRHCVDESLVEKRMALLGIHP